MKFKTTFRLFVIVCVVGALTWIVEQRFESTAERRKRTSKILQMKAEKINNLSIKWGDSSVDCVWEDGTWFFTRPFEAPANDGEIERVLSVLEAMPKEEVITASQRRERDLTLEDYGLREPRARFKSDRRELLVGNNAPLGDLVYVKLSDSHDVIATYGSVTNIIPESIKSLRDRTVLHGDAARTTRLEIQRPDEGFIQLARTGGEWLVQQPITARADSGKISQILDALYSLQVKEFVRDTEVEPTDIGRIIDLSSDPGARDARYRTAPDEAVVRVTVWGNGDEVGKELLFGKEAGENGDKVYARRRDINSIYTVQKDIVGILSLSVNDLRDRNLFAVKPENVNYVSFEKDSHKLVLEKDEKKGWVVVEPVQWKADDHVVRDAIGKLTSLRIESFADSTQTNMSKLGLNPPACIVQLLESYREPSEENGRSEGNDDVSAGREEVQKKKNRLWIGASSEKRETVFVRFEDKPVKFGDEASVFEISAAAIGGLGVDPADPLVYRDRTMMALHPESIKRITLLRDGKEQTVARDESGEWIAVAPTTNQVNQQAVEDIVFVASNLRALRIESHNPENVAQYGLDRMKFTLTFGLSGGGGIQKSLIMGFRSRTDGIYAMVQGQDVVFVLENSLVERLTGGLVKPLTSQEDQRSGNDRGK